MRDRGRRRRRRDVLAVALIGLLAASATLTTGVAGARALSRPHSAAQASTGPGEVRAVAASRSAASSSRPAAPTPRPEGRSILFDSWLAGHAQPALDVKAQSAILIDVDTRQVLWERDPRSVRAPASLVKLVTAMVVADQARSFDQGITVPPEADVKAIEAIEPNSTVMGITTGEVLTVRELLMGLFIVSGNDAAEALARGIVPRSRFIQLMNQKAAAIGMEASHFTTPVGLDDPGMVSTAQDLAVAGWTIDTQYPALAALAGLHELDLPQTATHKAFSAVNWMHTFMQTYPGATGMKTGYTDDAGGCTVATATRTGRRLVAVAMRSDVFISDAEKMLDYGFAVPSASLSRRPAQSAGAD